MESIEKLRELAADINAREIVDHMELYPSCVFDGHWLDAWHRQFDKLLEAIQDEVDEKYVELPVDTDGVPIKPGDIMQFRDDAPVRVDSIGNSKCYVGDFGWFGDNGGFYGKGTLKCCRHVKPRTMRDILFDFMRDCCTGELTNSELVEKYEVELRELLGGDEE